LLAVQFALLTMCAARGDLFAVLALPEHYREDEAVEHVETLKLPPEKIHGTAGIEALGFGESSDFSYAAVYHPWLIGRKEERLNNFRRIPPDGAACGILARRALARGAWIAPANELLSGVVGLTPTVSSERRLSLQEAQINLVRQEPRGFVALSADTLSDDPDLRPINVRRLLMLLRRLALRLGSRYVFEPNDDSFRRLVQRGFEAMLDDMFVRGAFAGATPATSFQVVTSSALNTPQSVDQGRFIVELRVAPSLPMTFLTIRLVQMGDRAFVTEGR
jgi:phage tail sheath protein FI